MDQHAVVEVVADAAGEGEAFAIAAEAQQVLGGMIVLHADDFLVDDRALVEVGGDVMAGGADEFHSAVVCAVIRVGADE